MMAECSLIADEKTNMGVGQLEAETSGQDGVAHRSRLGFVVTCAVARGERETATGSGRGDSWMPGGVWDPGPAERVGQIRRRTEARTGGAQAAGPALRCTSGGRRGRRCGGQQQGAVWEVVGEWGRRALGVVVFFSRGELFPDSFFYGIGLLIGEICIE
jgi:hypothetical protein